MDKTPQEIIEEREEHYKSDDRKIRYYYEDKLEEFRQFLIDHHYGARTIKAYLGRVAGLFSNNRLGLLLDKSFWAKSNKDSSEIAQALETTKRYPDNDEMRLIIELADNRQALGILFGYQCGLSPSDTISLTWDRLNIDFENEQREYHQLTLPQLKQTLRTPIIIDGRNVYDRHQALEKGLTFRGVGLPR